MSTTLSTHLKHSNVPLPTRDSVSDTRHWHTDFAGVVKSLEMRRV